MYFFLFFYYSFLTLGSLFRLQSSNNKFLFAIAGLCSPSCAAFGIKIWAAAASPSKPGYTMALSPCRVTLELSRVGIKKPEPLQLQFYLVMLLITRISKGNPYAVRGCSGLGQGCKY